MAFRVRSLGGPTNFGAFRLNGRPLVLKTRMDAYEGRGFNSSALRQSWMALGLAPKRFAKPQWPYRVRGSMPPLSANFLLSVAGNLFGKEATAVRSDQEAPVPGKCRPRGAGCRL